MQYAHAEQSMTFAQMVQKHYAKNTPITDRGAKQGPYLVLCRTAMPSVLTEMGFMTNKSDRDYLHSEVGQKQVAKSLFDAFSEYRAKCNAKAEEAVVLVPEVATKVEEKPATTPSAQPTAQPSKPATQPTKEVAKSEGVRYYVQICTLSKKSDPADRKFGKWAGKIEQRQTSSGKWRCLIPAKDKAEAQAIKAEAEKQFSGAYVVQIEN